MPVWVSYAWIAGFDTRPRYHDNKGCQHGWLMLCEGRGLTHLGNTELRSGNYEVNGENPLTPVRLRHGSATSLKRGRNHDMRGYAVEVRQRARVGRGTRRLHLVRHASVPDV